MSTEPSSTPPLDFLIIGGQRCGSTWVSSTLDQHPQIVMGAPKELHYFSRFVLHHDLAWYRSHFDVDAGGDDRQLGEATPAYGSLASNAVQAVRDALPDLRLVMIVRNPIDRTWSHLCSRFGPGPNRPSEAFALRRALHQIHRRTTRDHNDFVATIDAWTSAFGRDQLHLMFFDDLVRDEQASLRGLTDFLGLEPHAFDLGAGRRFGATLVEMPPEVRWHVHHALDDVVRAQVAYLGPKAEPWLDALQDDLPSQAAWRRRFRTYTALGAAERLATEVKHRRRQGALARAIRQRFAEVD